MAKGPIKSTRTVITGILLLGLLPIVPSVSAVGIGLVGLYVWLTRRVKRWWILPFVAYGFLGGIGQLFTPVVVLPKPPPWIDGSRPTRNVVMSWTPRKVVGQIYGDGLYTNFALDQHNGFWRVPRRYPQTQKLFDEFWWEGLYDPKIGEAITASFYFRHDGSKFDFQIVFFTNTGNHIGATSVVDLGDGLYRAYSTYTPSPEDGWVWPPRLRNLEGDWTYFDFGFVQLEPGSKVSSYIPGDAPDPGVWVRAMWWIGTALLGFLVLHGSIYLISRIKISWLATSLNLGLLLHLGVGLIQRLYLGEVAEPRVAGFLEHHNLYGHLGVTIAGLVGLMVGGYSRIFAWLSGLTVVWISGTRGALFGMMLLIIYWWFSLPKWPRLWIAALVALLMIFGTEDRLGRFATVFDINYGTTQWRIELAQFAIAEWRKYPFAGIGINRFSTLPEAHDRFIAGHPHSLPVALLVETGLIGCVAFCLLWGFIVWRLVHIRNWKALAVLGTVFLLNLTDYSFFNTVVYIPLWVVVAWGISNGGSVSVRMTQ